MTKLSSLRSLPFAKGGDFFHSAHDEHGLIMVIDDGDRRILNFDSLFEQSCMQLAHPYKLAHEYTQIMLLALAFIEPKHITLLGLGGGSLLRTLHHLLPDARFHVVELRQIVVDAARHYFSMPEDDRVEISVHDAVQKMTKIPSASSDIIFSDIYDAYRMVPEQLQMPFLKQCARALSPQGWLVLNLHSLPSDRMAFFAGLRGLFPTVILGTIAENIVLFLSKSEPQYVSPKLERVLRIEEQLQQRLARFIPRLQPLDFEFK